MLALGGDIVGQYAVDQDVGHPRSQVGHGDAGDVVEFAEGGFLNRNCFALLKNCIVREG